MSSSVILTNSVLCGIAAILLIPLLRNPNILTLKKGLPVFCAIVLVFIKMLIPYEFSFTHTLASQNILPVFKAIENFSVSENITIGRILLCLWVLIAVLLFFLILHKHWKLRRILALVPETRDQEVLQELTVLCKRKHIQHKPKVIKLDIGTSPFIVGVRNPVLVLPYLQFTKDEISYILNHELEHIKNHHLIIKMCLEVVTAIYWWNPIIWLMRRKVICALEIQADTYVIQKLSIKASISYLEALLHLCKKKQKDDSSLSLSFSLTNSMVEHRIKTALKHDYFQKKQKFPYIFLLPLILSFTLLLSSFAYTFEAYSRNPPEIKETFSVDPETDYLILRTDGRYDLYINGEYVAIVTSILDDFSDLPILN